MSRSSPLVVALVAGLWSTAAAQESAAPAAKVDFSARIRPILSARCYDCHGPDKQEGELRLDRRAAVFATRDDPVLVPGDPEASVLYQRISLPSDDSDRMPQEGTPLNAEQIALIRTWISEGAVWPESADAEAEAERAALHPPPIEVAPLSEEAKAACDRAVQALRDKGVLVQAIAADTPALEVNMSLAGDTVRGGEIAALAGLEPVLVWLNLARTGVDDAALQGLETFRELRRLDLSNTAAGDAAVRAVAKLDKLEYLNVYGTQVSDSGVAALAEMPALRRVFLWQSKASDAGIAKLRDARPGLLADFGAAAAMLHEVTAVYTPCNDKCPLTGKPIDPAYTFQFEGKAVGFCCGECRTKFSADPAKYAAELAAVQHKTDAAK